MVFLTLMIHLSGILMASASLLPSYTLPSHSVHHSEPSFHIPAHEPPKFDFQPLTNAYSAESVYRPNVSPAYHVNPVFGSLEHDSQEEDFHVAPVHHHRTSYGSDLHFDESPKPYAFGYGVKDDYSGANFGHSESSDGKVVRGEYTVALPDGRIQKVTYTADEYNGYRATVTYEGEAKYPDFVPKAIAPHRPAAPNFVTYPDNRVNEHFHSSHERLPSVQAVHSRPISRPLQHYIPPFEDHSSRESYSYGS